MYVLLILLAVLLIPTAITLAALTMHDVALRRSTAPAQLTALVTPDPSAVAAMASLGMTAFGVAAKTAARQVEEVARAYPRLARQPLRIDAPLVEKLPPALLARVERARAAERIESGEDTATDTDLALVKAYDGLLVSAELDAHRSAGSLFPAESRSWLSRDPIAR